MNFINNNAFYTINISEECEKQTIIDDLLFLLFAGVYVVRTSVLMISYSQIVKYCRER